MIQPVLFFALGFLCAGFLALLVAPAVWRRAVRLTRRRVEASVPLTLSEIQADKDSMRAGFAMAVRKLEMDVRALREKSAEQMVEIGRSHEALALLERERAALDEKLAQSVKDGAAAREELGQHAARVQELSERLKLGEQAVAERSLELERLGQLYDEASFSASNRQIELVSREAELEKLSSNLSVLREENKNLARKGKEAQAEGQRADTALNAEKKKVADLDKKLQRMMATLADRDDKIDRREKELARLRQQPKASAAAVAVRGDREIDKAIAKLDADRRNLEGKLVELARENKKRRGEAVSGEAIRSGPEVLDDDAGLLRDQMHELAAEVVALTARLEGEEALISRVLAISAQPPSGDNGTSMMSLADRIKALRKTMPAA
ncbi:MAG: hypothetical protein WBA36_07715 [Mesorhizobium sp.]